MPVSVYAIQRDPTKTTVLRDMFARNMSKRFKELRGVIRKAIVDEDCFGLKNNNNGLIFQQMTTPGHKAFDFTRSADKVQGFMDWLKEQTDKGILEIQTIPGQTGAGIEQAWTNIYIKKSYESGIIQARANLKKSGYSLPEFDDIYESQLPFPDVETIDTGYVFMDTIHLDRLGLLYTRTFNDLKGITSAMDAQISRVLAQGMADGKNPLELAKILNKTISGPDGGLGITDILGRYIPAERRAKMLARTEIIRAHARATVQEYRRAGVLGVSLKAEILTSGGACPQCEALIGNIYTLDEAENLIPVHPHCECTLIPVLPNE